MRTFLERPALQVSRRNNHTQNFPQTAVAKFFKVLHFPGRTPMSGEGLRHPGHFRRTTSESWSTCFPGDQDEHGAILRAGIVRNGPSLRLLIQDVRPAEFGTDYVAGRYGYRALTPTFIHREILQCRDARLGVLGCPQSRKRPAGAVQQNRP